MSNSPLWLCLKIAGGKERKAHELFLSHAISSLPPLTQTVRVNRHHRTAAQRTVERLLLPGYAFVARDHSEPTEFETRLLRLQFPADESPYKAIRGREPGVIDDIVRRQFQPITRPVVHRVMGWVSHASIMILIAACEAQAPSPTTPTFKPGDKARILVAGDLREVELAIVKGKRVRVMLDGREISTTLDKLEAAA